MAASLVLVAAAAVTVRAVLFRSSLVGFISERVEVVSPLSSWKRVVEGLSLLDLGVSPYTGNVFHETPLIIYLFHFLIDYAEFVFMAMDVITAVALYLVAEDFNKVVFRKQRIAFEFKKYASDVISLVRTPKEMYHIPLKCGNGPRQTKKTLYTLLEELRVERHLLGGREWSTFWVKTLRQGFDLKRRRFPSSHRCCSTC